jgi:hypothetical protein
MLLGDRLRLAAEDDDQLTPKRVHPQFRGSHARVSQSGSCL